MKRTRRKDPLSPAIFREAAARVESGKEKFACCALNEVSKEMLGLEGLDLTSAATWFARLLRPHGGNGAWYSDYSESNMEPYYDQYDWCLARNRGARVMGLLLCALLIEEGYTHE